MQEGEIMRKVKKIFCVAIVFLLTVLNFCKVEAAVVVRVAGVVARGTSRIFVGAASAVFRSIGKNLVIDAATDKILDVVLPDKKISENTIKNIIKNASKATTLVKEKIPNKKSVENVIEDVTENANKAVAFVKGKISDKMSDEKNYEKKSDDKLIRVDKATVGSAIEKKFSEDKYRLNLPSPKVMEKL